MDLGISGFSGAFSADRNSKGISTFHLCSLDSKDIVCVELLF